MDSTKSVLFLSRDGTFQQQVYRAGKVEHTQGTWRRVGEEQSGPVFQKQLIY